MRSYTYDESGSLIQVIDGDDQPEISSTDVVTRYNQQTGGYQADPYGLIRLAETQWNNESRSLTYNYDPMQRLTQITTPSGRNIDYSYDQLGRLAAMENYLNGHITYNTRGMAQNLTYANGISREYTWDSDGRLDSLSYLDGSDEVKDWDFEYDDADNLIKKGSNAYSYDSLDRLTHAYLLDGFEVRDIDRGIEEVATATQDYRGEAPLILADSDISLKLDTASASIGVILTTIPVEVTRIFLHPGNPNHRIQERHLEIYYKADEVDAFQKITSWNYHRGPEGTIELRLEAPVSATEIKVHCHFNELDPNGDPIDAATFANSPENIITIHYLMPHREETYSYDKVGNRLAQSITQKGTETRNSQYGENKVLLMHNGKTGYVYDILGNLIEKGSDYTYNEVTQTSTVQPSTQDYRRYHYDLFGRMKEVWGVDPETQSLVLLAEYVYDFRGMRIAKIKDGHITRYHLDEEGRNLETETTDESVTTAWIGQKPLGYTDNEGTYWYISDHQGSTFMLTDGEGNILWEDAVNPFGITAGSRGSQDSQVLYTGKIFDADADLYYFNARWYDPETGRFASEDPARDGVNWYAYVGNNPLKFVDPTGLTELASLIEAETKLLNEPVMLSGRQREQMIVDYSRSRGIDPVLLGAVLQVESGKDAFGESGLTIRIEAHWFDRFSRGDYGNFVGYNEMAPWEEQQYRTSQVITGGRTRTESKSRHRVT